MISIPPYLRDKTKWELPPGIPTVKVPLGNLDYGFVTPPAVMLPDIRVLLDQRLPVDEIRFVCNDKVVGVIKNILTKPEVEIIE